MNEPPGDSSVEPEDVETSLKSERIGQQLTGAQIAERLSALPGWQMTDDAKALRRIVELPSFRAAAAFVAYLAELVEATDHPPAIEIRGHEVIVTLRSRSADRLTERDLALATRIQVCA